MLWRWFVLLAMSVAFPSTGACSSAALSPAMIQAMSENISEVMRKRLEEERAKDSSIDKAVQSAPPEIVAARAVERANARMQATEIPSTLQEIRSVTSLLDAEPAVREFHSRLKQMTLPQSDADSAELANARVYQGVDVSGFRRVVVLIDEAGAPVCTGTLISPKYILTAAHCLCRRPAVAPSPTRLTHAAVGSAMEDAVIIDQLDPSKAKWMGNGSVCAGSLEDPDIAIVGFSTHKALGLPPLQFADDAEVDSSDALRVIGFGRGNGSITSSGVKRAALVPIVSKNCTGQPFATPGRTFASVFECVEGREIVAGRLGGADTCRGDSGGPAFLAVVDEPSDMFPQDIPVSELRLAAVTSRGVKTPEGALDDCGYGGIYVRISSGVRQFLVAAIAS